MSYCANDHCVCNMVKDIVAAQDEAAKNADDGCCSTSCEQSIQDLLRPSPGNSVTGHSTIPFVLYCQKSCRPFVSSGVYQTTDNDDVVYDCIKSPIFRAKNFTDDNSCCVRLELLAPVSDGNMIDDTDEVCEIFQDNNVTEFLATGICITVDLNSFNGIQCLNAITPIPSENFPLTGQSGA